MNFNSRDFASTKQRKEPHALKSGILPQSDSHKDNHRNQIRWSSNIRFTFLEKSFRWYIAFLINADRM